MENPASTEDLKARGYDLPTDAAVEQTRLDAAWRQLQLEVPSVVTSIEAGWLTSEAVADVVADAALRVLRNPEGVIQEDGAIDDYREGRRYSDASMDLYFTAAEKRRLTRLPTPTAGSMKYI